MRTLCINLSDTSALYHHCASFGRPMASIERSLWRPLCLHSATTATLEPPCQWFCLHSAFFVRHVVPLQQLWSFKEGTGVVLQQLHRNRTFWVPATTERPNHFYGRTKVARRSQPCVKGALLMHYTLCPPQGRSWQICHPWRMYWYFLVIPPNMLLSHIDLVIVTFGSLFNILF